MVACSPQVACETCSKTNMVMVFGEITTKAKVDYEAIVRKTCKEIGFTSDDVGLDGDKCKVWIYCLAHVEHCVFILDEMLRQLIEQVVSMPDDQSFSDFLQFVI